MNILVVLGCSRDIGQVAAGAMLATLGFAGSPTRVHQEKRGFRIHRDGIDSAPFEVFEHIIDEIIAPLHHGLRREILALMAAPNENLVNLLAFLPGHLDGIIRARLVIYDLSIAAIAIRVNHDAASRVRRAKPGGFTTESPEYNRVDNAQPRAGKHRDRQLRNHGHVNRDSVASL